MRTDISPCILKAHQNIDNILWRTACACKEQDNDITINGLFVRVTKSSTKYWTGTAFPYESSSLHYKVISHPAGRINLRLTIDMIDRSVVILFAHELRHIGQFHRGRKKFGFLVSEAHENDSEDDSREFEKLIADAVMHGTKTYRGIDSGITDRLLFDS